MPVWIFCLYYVLYYQLDEKTLESFIPRLYTEGQKDMKGQKLF